MLLTLGAVPLIFVCQELLLGESTQARVERNYLTSSGSLIYLTTRGVVLLLKVNCEGSSAIAENKH